MDQALPTADLESPSFTRERARNVFLTTMLVIAVCLVGVKASGSISVGGQSIYPPYIALALGLVFIPRVLTGIFVRYFAWPMAVILVLSFGYFLQSGGQAIVFLFGIKVFITFAMAAMYVYLLRQDEAAVMRWLYFGMACAVAYMVYQAISSVAFGSSLPFTTIPALQIGRGLSSRYGLPRMTGFTEEPSYMAVMLIGSVLMLNAYRIRSRKPISGQIWVLGLALLLCTSNSLFATIPLLLLFIGLTKIRLPLLFFVFYYIANLAISGSVVRIDESFFARFSSYDQFLHLPVEQWWFGIGLNRYASLDFPIFYSPVGTPVLTVDSIGSLWGGVLLEGGLVFTTLFCVYISGIATKAKQTTGYAFMGILIMLSDYYSPWWPIVSLGLAYSLFSREAPSPAELESSETPSLELELA